MTERALTGQGVDKDLRGSWSVWCQDVSNGNFKVESLWAYFPQLPSDLISLVSEQFGGRGNSSDTLSHSLSPT